MYDFTLYCINIHVWIRRHLATALFVAFSSTFKAVNSIQFHRRLCHWTITLFFGRTL